MAFPKIDGFVVTEKLGSGSYSTVYKAYTKVGARSIVAIKCVDKSRVKHSGTAVDNLITEIRLLKTLRHPYIVHMKDFTWDNKNIYIITEYCCGGDLSHYIHRNGRVPEKQVLYFLQQLVSALKFLREKGVVHMDLKPHNLLLHKGSNNKYLLKVADFGFAQYMSSESIESSIRGSPLYMAPEMLTHCPSYDARVDLWSVGVIMYECLFGKAPYSSNTFKELMDKIQSRQPIQIPSKSSISSGCQDLLTRLLQHDPDCRISYDELFAHDYLDLEHMPSKENYDKAVYLIKQAVELDGKGRYVEAFPAYCDSLRYLVPVVNYESDPVRKSALRAKVNRYMQRAEELKVYTKCTESNRFPDADALITSTAADASTSRAVTDFLCCTDSNAVSSNSVDFGVDKGNNATLCNCTRVQLSSTNGVSYKNRHYEPSDGTNERQQASRNAEATSSDRAASQVAVKTPNSPKLPGLKWLFGNKPTKVDVPYLDKDIAEKSRPQESPSKENAGEAVGDGCRIT